MNSKIHPSSIVHPDAKIDGSVEIGPFCTVGPNVTIAEKSRLISHVVIDGRTTIGEQNTFYPFSNIGLDPQDLKFKNEDTGLIIGDRNTFRESVSVHLGTVTGSINTIIGDDNLFMGYVHVAHDCMLGNSNVLANYVGLSGHVVLEDFITLGGQVGVVQFLRVGSYSYIGGASVVDVNVPPFSSGYGNRLKIKGVNVVGLKRAGYSRDSIRNIAEAHRLYFRSDLSKEESLRRIKAEIGEFEEIGEFLRFFETN